MAPPCVQSLHCSVHFSLIYLGVIVLGAFRFNNVLSAYSKETPVTHRVTQSPVKLAVVRSALLEGLCRSLLSICTAYCSSWSFSFYTREARGTAGEQWSQQCGQPLCKVKSTSLPWGLAANLGSQRKRLWRIPPSSLSQFFSQSLNSCSLNFLR